MFGHRSCNHEARVWCFSMQSPLLEWFAVRPACASRSFPRASPKIPKAKIQAALVWVLKINYVPRPAKRVV